MDAPKRPRSTSPLRPEDDRNDDVVVSLAVTLDGYICRPDGAVDYLDNYPVEGYDIEVWAARVGALVMGRATYEQALEFGWAWGDLPTLVLTHQTGLPVPDSANVSFRAAPTVDAIRGFAAETPGRLWVFGGGDVMTEALVGGVVDTLDMVIVPEAISEGVPLFTRPYNGPMRVVQTTSYPDGELRVVYDTTSP